MSSEGVMILVSLVALSLSTSVSWAAAPGVYDVQPLTIDLDAIGDECDPTNGGGAACTAPQVCAITLSGTKCVEPNLIYCADDTECTVSDPNIWGCFLADPLSTNRVPGLRGICNGCDPADTTTTCDTNPIRNKCWVATNDANTAASVGLCVQCTVDADCGSTQYCQTSLSDNMNSLDDFNTCVEKKDDGASCKRDAECQSDSCKRGSIGFLFIQFPHGRRRC